MVKPLRGTDAQISALAGKIRDRANHLVRRATVSDLSADAEWLRAQVALMRADIATLSGWVQPAAASNPEAAITLAPSQRALLLQYAEMDSIDGQRYVVDMPTAVWQDARAELIRQGLLNDASVSPEPRLTDLGRVIAAGLKQARRLVP